MNRLDHEDSAACLLATAAPRCALEVRRRPADLDGERRQEYATQRPALDGRVEGAASRGEAVLEDAPEDHPCRTACLDHCRRRCRVLRDRLLRQHVPTGPGGGQREREMKVVRCDDVHRIHFCVLQQFLGAPERMRDAVLAGEGLRTAPVHIRHGGHLDPRQEADGLGVRVRHTTGAEEPEPKRHHASLGALAPGEPTPLSRRFSSETSPAGTRRTCPPLPHREAAEHAA